MEPVKIPWGVIIDSAKLELEFCLHWSEPTLFDQWPSSGCGHPNAHVDLDWAEFKRNAHSEILECFPLGGEHCQDASYAGLFLFKKKKKSPSLFLETFQMEQECCVQTALQCACTSFGLRNPSLFLLLFTKPSTFLVLFSCPIWKSGGRRVLTMLLTWASACCSLKQPVAWAVHESMLKTLPEIVFSLNGECSSPKSFSAHKSVDQTDGFYDLLEYTQWLWCASSLWACMYLWEAEKKSIIV